MSRQVPLRVRMDERFDGCKSRLQSHWWEAIESKRQPKYGGFYLRGRCVNCGSERWMIIDYYGRPLGPWKYKPAPGYRDNKDSRQTVSEWRVAFLRRTSSLKLNGDE